MSADTLDSLTDAELSELFAVEVAGFTNIRDGYPWEVNDEPPEVRRVGRVKLFDSDSLPTDPVEVPDFATSADAVLPWLEKTRWAGHSNGMTGSTNGYPHASIDIYLLGGLARARGECFHGDSLTRSFARAACLALLRAKRASKL